MVVLSLYLYVYTDSDIVALPCGCNHDSDSECQREDFKFPMFIGKYRYYVLTSIDSKKTASDSKNFVVLVTNLIREINDADLLNLFQPYGNVINAKVARCPHTGVTGSFGFVYFENKDDAQRAIHKLDRTIPPKHIKATIGVEWAVAPSTT